MEEEKYHQKVEEEKRHQKETGVCPPYTIRAARSVDDGVVLGLQVEFSGMGG